MTACENIRQHLSALLDGELAVEDSSVVNEHLDSCDACRNEWESLQAVDAQLKQVLTIDDFAQRVATIEQAAEIRSSSLRTRGKALRWSGIIAAVAASITIAFFALRPNQVPGPIGPKVEIVAHLVRATGTVEIQSPGSDAWTSVASIVNHEVEKGARLRTGESVLVEMLTTDDGKIRLNESAEMVMRDASKLELVKGQLWLSARASEISVDVPIQDEDSGTIATLTCPSQSEYQCQAGNTYAACESVSPKNPKTEWAVGAFTCAVDPGETVSIDAKQNVDRKQTPASTSKVWQLPLLAVGHSVDDEFLSSMKSLLSPIGMTKARHLNEEQIRRLGPRGAVPLLAFVQAENTPDQLGLRRTATGIAADLADEHSIELLQKIETDPDTYISRRATEALKRIAEQSK